MVIFKIIYFSGALVSLVTGSFLFSNFIKEADSWGDFKIVKNIKPDFEVNDIYDKLFYIIGIIPYVLAFLISRILIIALILLLFIIWGGLSWIGVSWIYNIYTREKKNNKNSKEN